MSLNEYIKNEIMRYGISGFDIGFALDVKGASRDYFPLADEKSDPFTIQPGQSGTPLAFPHIAVKLLLMVIDKLANGEAPVMLPRFQNITFEETTNVFNLSKQELQKLIAENKLVPHLEEDEMRLCTQDIVNFKVDAAKSTLAENTRPVHFEPQDVISARIAYPNLDDIINELGQGEFYYLKRKINEIGALRISKTALQIVFAILSDLTIAHILMSFPIPIDVSVEEASEILHFPMDYTHKLLIDNIIHFRKYGNSCSIALSDLMQYKKMRDKEQLEALQEMTDLWIDELKLENEETLACS